MFNPKFPQVTTRYHVWRRSDGYVGASTSMPADEAAFTFKLLKEFGTWDADTIAFIEKSRSPTS